MSFLFGSCIRREIRYYYDNLNQLVREDNGQLNKTYVYTYDNAGNITSKSTYSLTDENVTPTNPTDTESYEYSSGTWGDQLTKYNGVEIEYDAIGNPLEYYNGAQFTWLGRQLVGASYNGKTMSFTYNDEGIRTSKTVNGITTTYYLSGSQIIGEETSGNITVYLYDASGSVIGMQYHAAGSASTAWDSYWFEKNLQGDIVAIYNASGTKLVSYIYDAWGNFTPTEASEDIPAVVTNNPFTYRGYYYDYDLGLYYLQSRYYDSNTGRLISADALMSGVNGSLEGFNLYVYCFNNPIMYTDHFGNWPEWVRKVGETINAFFGAFYGTVSVGVGVGASASATVHGAKVEVSAKYVEKDTFSISENRFDITNSHEIDAEVRVLNLLNIGASTKQEHSYYDEDCTCDLWWDSYTKKTTCPAHKDTIDSDIKLDFSVGAYLGIGAEASCGFNLTYFVNELIEIFSK